MLVAPCKDCDQRHVSCHSTCESYKNWSDECQKLKESINADRKVNAELAEHRRYVGERIRRRHGSTKRI